jgi:hypothetical protein
VLENLLGGNVEDIDGARLVRDRLVRAVRPELLRRCAAPVVEEALADAILLDEVALLPARQQFAVRAAAAAVAVRDRRGDRLDAYTGGSAAHRRAVVDHGAGSRRRRSAELPVGPAAGIRSR